MISVYFGSPGCGKSTFEVSLLRSRRNRKKYRHFFTDLAVDRNLAYSISFDQLGHWVFPDHSLICLDEAGITFNNRQYKSLSKEAIQWFKLHRHYHCDVAVFSQSWEDMDVTIRRLANKIYYLQKIGPFTIAREIRKFSTVDKESQQIIDGYRVCSFLWNLVPGCATWHIIFRPFHYKYFNSYDVPKLPLIPSQNILN